MAVGQLQLLVVGVILGLAARGATSPTAQQMTDEEEKELLANLMLDLGIDWLIKCLDQKILRKAEQMTRKSRYFNQKDDISVSYIPPFPFVKKKLLSHKKIGLK